MTSENKFDQNMLYSDKGNEALSLMARDEVVTALEHDDYYTCASDIVADVRRVYGYRRDLLDCQGNVRLKYVVEWLRGLPLHVTFMTYSICKLVLEYLGFTCDEADAEVFRLSEEEKYEIDCLYWDALGIAVLEMCAEEEEEEKEEEEEEEEEGQND